MMFRLFLAILVVLPQTSCLFKKEKTLLINGAGASFPYILYSKWIMEYKKVNPSVRINYQSIGSGGGVRQFLAGTLDFGGTDIPLFEQETNFKENNSQQEQNSQKDKKSDTTQRLKTSQRESSSLKRKRKTQAQFKKPILHLPTALGAVAVTYNLPSLNNKTLKLNGEVLARIFRGKIKFWDDPQIQSLNPELKLPHQKLILIYRAEGSGTTSFFTEFLSLKSPDFLKEVGHGKSVSWPQGLGAKGNEGVMGLLKKIEGSISYVGLSYARSQNLPVVAIQNKEGFFIEPSLNTTQSAALSALKNQNSYTSSLIDEKGAKSYPISGYTYFIISKQPEPKGSVIFSFMEWILKDGQHFSKDLYFIPLPKTVQEKALQKLSEFKNKT